MRGLSTCGVMGLAVGLVLAFDAAAVRAESFPTHQVTIVSPYQAGGTSDIIARILAQKLGALWHQTVIVENRPGANGGIGVGAVAHAPADGYTLLATASSSLTLNPILYHTLSYDVGRDLAPITRTGTVSNVLVVHPSVAAASVPALIALAKSKPGTLTYASQGPGSNGHLIGEMFRQRAGIEMLHVPYKGSAPAVSDLLGGQVQLMFDNLPTVLEQIRAGRLRALAVTTAARSPLLPDVPTIAETALPGFDVSAWFAVMVAKGVPQEIRSQIETAVVSVMDAPETRERLSALGIDVTADGAAALERRIADETKQWRAIVETAGIDIN